MTIRPDADHRGTADAVIIGGGLVGLACAAALARDGARAILLDDARPGAASTAAAGMLAPSVDREVGPAHTFAIAARDRYPAYLGWLTEATGIEVAINTAGILQVAITARGVKGLRRSMPSDAAWIEGPALTELEPSLSHALGAVMHSSDGAVDNVALIEALTRYCATSERITTHRVAARQLVPVGRGASVRTADGSRFDAEFVVVAGGAWASAIRGLPRPIPVSPARGQMLAFDPVPLRHVLFGPRGYIIPRSARADASAETLVGATTERVGFDSGTTPSAAATLQSVATEILPQLARSLPRRHWAGLRPMTPDLLPILGADPAEPRLLYACGHSRNGILLAPLTGDCISALARCEAPGLDLAPFRVDRFQVQPAPNRAVER